MTVNLVQWRAVIGIFNCRSSVMPSYECNLNKNLASLFEVLLFCWHCFENDFIFLLTLVYIYIYLYFYIYIYIYIYLFSYMSWGY